MKSFLRQMTCLAAALFASGTNAQSSAPVLDTRPAFMQILTNYVVETRMQIVTNYLAVTNALVVTNFYNAQGQLLQPVPPSRPPIPGLIPIPQPQPQPAPPDPAVIKARQLQAVRDLLALGLAAASNQVCAAKSFTDNPQLRIPLPEGVVSLDRNKREALVTAMNVTAEKAAPQAIAALARSAGQFQPDDSESLLKGASDAVTRAWLAGQQETLERELLAIVQRAGVEPKLRQAYSDVMLRGGGLLGAVLGTGPSVDIETYVAQRLLEAIAQRVAAHEGTIRTTPSARKTPALQEVFGK